MSASLVSDMKDLHECPSCCRYIEDLTRVLLVLKILSILLECSSCSR